MLEWVAFLFFSASIGGGIIACILEMRRPRHREVQSFAQVTQLLGDGGRI